MPSRTTRRFESELPVISSRARTVRNLPLDARRTAFRSSSRFKASLDDALPNTRRARGSRQARQAGYFEL